MRDLLNFLQQNAFLALLFLGWILSAVGGVLKKASKRAEAARKMQTPPSPAQASSLPVPQLPRRRPSSEEVAAEMRRILGMDAPPAQRSRPVPAPVPPPPPVRRSVVTAPVVKTGPVSRVGELRATMERRSSEIENRKAPVPGSVVSAQLGSLGGREPVRQQLRRQAAGLIDLNDLPRLFVMTEVLGKPLALRDDWQAR